MVYFTADAVQQMVNDSAIEISKRGESNFVKCLFSFGTYLFLEGIKDSVNTQLCAPLKPSKAPSTLPNYYYEMQKEREIPPGE